MTSARPGRSIGAGIGLVSTMVVLLIVMAMYFGTFGGKSYMQNVAASKKQAQATAAEVNTQQLLTCIAAYKLSNNRLPKTAEELDAGPALRDPWGKEMTFTYQQAEGPQGATVVIWRSAGPDGEMNTPDDVVKQDRLML